MNSDHLDKWIGRRKERRENFSLVSLFTLLIQGDITVLSTCLTVLESTRTDDQVLAKQLIESALPLSGNSIRIGITGVPGVGKSTFIESFGKLLTDQGHKVAVLAIDPSSSENGGSILGDKTRMTELSVNPKVFIRPTAAGATLGGVARKTRESIYLCEAAGFDVILIETVGVGQSETYVHSMVDFFLLLMLSGAGDELQGIKRGIMEMADALVITKADGDNEMKSKIAATAYKNAIHLFPPKKSNWIVPVLTCSSINNSGMQEVNKSIEGFSITTKANGWFAEHRKIQDSFWLKETLRDKILNEFFGDEKWLAALEQQEKMVYEGAISSFQAADNLYKQFKG
ncbi:MAG: methylmalonyl Co-A mutase-associated GTPase MeaB [Bacteroidota bacterium]